MDRSRRRFLAAIGLAPAWSWFLPANASASRPPSDVLISMFSDLAAPLGIGRAYLRDHPGEQDADLLLRQVFGAVSPPDSSTMRAHLADRRREDFTRGRTVCLDGWVLGRTEAQACALTCLLVGGADA